MRIWTAARCLLWALLSKTNKGAWCLEILSSFVFKGALAIASDLLQVTNAEAHLVLNLHFSVFYPIHVAVHSQTCVSRWTSPGQALSLHLLCPRLPLQTLLHSALRPSPDSQQQDALPVLGQSYKYTHQENQASPKRTGHKGWTHWSSQYRTPLIFILTEPPELLYLIENVRTKGHSWFKNSWSMG